MAIAAMNVENERDAMRRPDPFRNGNGRLSGRVAIVTVAASKTAAEDANLVGTGKAIAIQLARDGASVLVVDRHEDHADAPRQWIEKEGGKAVSLALELSYTESSRKIAATAIEHFDRIDSLVAKAAAYASSGFLETTK